MLTATMEGYGSFLDAINMKPPECRPESTSCNRYMVEHLALFRGGARSDFPKQLEYGLD